MALTKVKANNITLTTAAANSNDTTPATTQYVTTAINNLIDGAPATLNTLDEIAAALNDDAALNTTLTNAIAAKLPLAGGSLTGDLTLTSATSNKPKLTITNTNADSSAPHLIFKKDSASPADNDEVGRIYMYGDDDGGNPFEAFLAIGKSTDVSNGSEDSSLDMYTYAAGAQKQTITLKEGNVGIGTTNPSSPLHVSAANNAGWVAQIHNTGTGSDANGLDIHAGVDSSDYILRTRHQDGTDAMVVKHGGKVGIGHNGPDEPLHVKGSGYQRVKIESTGAHADLQLKSGGSTTQWLLFNDSDSGNNSGVIKYQHSDNTMRFRTNDIDDRLVIDTSGNVGIGTASPFGTTTNRTCLSVNGTSSVSLNIGVGNAQKGYLYTDGNAAQFGSVGSIPLKFAPNDSPKMELFPSGELSMYGNKMVIDSDYSHWSGKYQHLTCHNAITSSNAWTDVAYVSYSPSLTIQGMAQRDNNGGYGASNFLGTIFGGYGAVSVVAERSVGNAMNGGGFGALEYRYLNGGASSGNYRLQVRIPITSGTMYVTTTLTGHAWQEIYED